jgi:hypothetical protein
MVEDPRGAHRLACSFRLIDETHFGYSVPDWDGKSRLVIDPYVLLYGKYLGGSSVDLANAIDVDRDGNVYVTGETQSVTFPTTTGAFDTTYNAGPRDVFVSKINPLGTRLVYSTYIGGDLDDIGFGIVAEAASGICYVTGSTAGGTMSTTSFPVSTGPPNFSGGTSDAFVSGFQYVAAPTQSINLLFSTYLGGADPDVGRSIVTTPAGDIFVTGMTNSANFPVTPGAYSTAINGGFGGYPPDAFVWKAFAPNIAIPMPAPIVVYSTYVGTAGYDEPFGIVISGSDAIITGFTTDSCFPATCFYPIGTPSNVETFVLRLNAAGNAVVNSLVFGTNHSESRGIAIDQAGDLYICGYTTAATFPVTAGSFGTTFAGVADGFVVKMH